MEYKQIQELIKLINKTNVSELKISQDDFQITIRTKDYAGFGSKVAKPDQPVQQITLTTPHTAQHQMPVSPHPAPSAAAPPPVDAGANDVARAATTVESDSSEDYDPDKFIVFKSPMIGTFYRRPSPDKDIFVNVGDTVKTGDVLCIIEAMKLFNEIEFEGDGVIAKVLVEDSTPVEYDQPLFLIEKSS